MRTLTPWIGGALAAALLLSVAAPSALAQEKKYKDDKEYPLMDAATKDIGAGNWTKALTDLDAWKKSYPESDWKQDRDFWILQGYLSTQQFDKALSFGNELMDRDLPTLFKASLGNVVATYYIVTTAGAQLITKNATPEQIAIGDKAAHKLIDFAPTYFVAANLPQGQTQAAFDQAKAQMLQVANGYLLQEAVAPGQAAEAKSDWPAAEAAYTKALTAYPDNTWISRHLATVYNKEEKPFLAMYEFARTAAIDPTQGKTTNGPQFVASVKRMYTQLNGSDQGLDQLMEQAKAAPIPPPDFKFKTKGEADAEAANKFAADNPEIARWQTIKQNLTQQGEAFFDTMKGAEVPTILATVADAKPACRSKELVLYVPAPDNKDKTNEITLKLEAPLTGKPELGQNVKFEAVADSFTPSPFMLVMTVDKEKLHDLKTSPCAAAPAKKGPVKKK